MKYFNSLLLLLLIGSSRNYVIGQSTNGVAANNNYNANNFLGWNNTNGANSLFFRTNAVNRMKINGSVAYPINNYPPLGRIGCMLIGVSNTSMINNNKNIYTGVGNDNSAGAFSLLHLNGTGSSYQEFGFRPWMETGVTFTGNRDFAYYGLRKVGTTEDHSEAVFLWADNVAGGGPDDPEGPDNMVFRFSGYGGLDGASVSADRNSTTDLDGLHVATFNPTGYFGLGNTFGMNAAGMTAGNYIRPQSLMHMSYDYRAGEKFQPYGFLQITYRKPDYQPLNYVGQGETNNDGLRFGIDNTALGSSLNYGHLNSYLRWQEASSFIIQTEDDGTPNINANERIRVTSVGALATNYSNTEYLGIASPRDATRVSISSSGATPVKKPMSLLHLGKDVSAVGAVSSADGWRNWMDIGTFISNGSDHMYVGLKSENTNGERMDAVINWGDDQGSPNSSGPENLRFIFTSPAGSPSVPTSGGGADGMEGMRMTPTDLNGVHTGIGGATGNSYFGGSANPTSTLEINSWGNTSSAGGASGLRFTNLNSSTPTVNNPGTGVLSVNSTGDVIYVPATAGTSGAFTDCANNTTAANLTVDSKVNLNNFNLFFENNSTTNTLGKNHIGVGYSCANPLPAKLSIIQTHPTTVNQNTFGTSVINNDVSSVQLTTYTGIKSVSEGIQLQPRVTNIGGVFEARGAEFNQAFVAKVNQSPYINSRDYGVHSSVYNINARNTWGGYFLGQGGDNSNIGVTGQAAPRSLMGSSTPSLIGYGGEFTSANHSNINVGVWGQAADAFPTSYHQQSYCYGVYGNAGNGVANFGVYGDLTNPNPNDRAGYFSGLIESTANFILLSDQMFKTDVNIIEGALDIVNSLNPKDYYLDTVGFTQMNFSSNKQFGFISQEVETILPNLVHNSLYPAKYDSLGVMTTSSIPYKSMNYTGIIPINTAAIKELDREFQNRTLSDQSIKTNVLDLNNSLSKVLAMRGVSYDWTAAGQANYSLDTCHHIGFIAQELQQVDSRLTFVGRDSLLHVEYEKVVPVLVEAIEELNSEVESKDSIIDAINARLTTLENCLLNILPTLCQMNQSVIQSNTPESQNAIRSQLSVKLNSSSSIILDQNVPNPFAEQTVINFSIPETVQKAQIHFYNSEGRIIQSVDITERGLGSLMVFGSDLSSGVYTYTLVADGVSVATKKMMKQ